MLNLKFIKQKLSSSQNRMYLAGFIILIVILGYALSTKSIYAVIIDGKTYQVQTSAGTTSALQRQIQQSIGDKTLKMLSGGYLTSGEQIEFATEKTITLNVDEVENTYTTFTSTYEDLYTELKEDPTILDAQKEYLILDPLDDKKFKNGDEISVYSFQKRVVEEKKDIAFESSSVDNPEVLEGTQTVITEGQKGVETTTYDVITTMKGEFSKTEIKKEITKKPVDEVIENGTKKPEVAKKAKSSSTPSSGSTWDQLAACESGGNWSINSGNGYYGGLQMNPTSWAQIAPGLGITAALPSDASREEQIMVAEVMQKNAGWGQWPHCASQIGLL